LFVFVLSHKNIITDDPHELHNLVGRNGMTANSEVIGKAEHLKLLLVEYLVSNNGGSKGYYSNEIGPMQNRRNWKKLPFWRGDAKIEFHSPVCVDSGPCMQNEFLYVGSSAEPSNANVQTLVISNITISGKDATHFKIDKARLSSYPVPEGKHLTLKVTYSASTKNVLLSLVDALVEFETNILGEGFQRVPIVFTSVRSRKREVQAPKKRKKLDTTTTTTTDTSKGSHARGLFPLLH